MYFVLVIVLINYLKNYVETQTPRTILAFSRGVCVYKDGVSKMFWEKKQKSLNTFL